MADTQAAKMAGPVKHATEWNPHADVHARRRKSPKRADPGWNRRAGWAAAAAQPETTVIQARQLAKQETGREACPTKGV